MSIFAEQCYMDLCRGSGRVSECLDLDGVPTHTGRTLKLFIEPLQPRS